MARTLVITHPSIYGTAGLTGWRNAFGYRAHIRIRGDLDYALLYRGQLVRGDPRVHIRNCVEDAHLDAAHALGVGEFAARLVCTNPGVSIYDVVDSRSPYRMVKIDDLANLPFAMALQNLALCTPNRSFTKDPGQARFAPPPRGAGTNLPTLSICHSGHVALCNSMSSDSTY
jgi:hypothetical protein